MHTHRLLPTCVLLLLAACQTDDLNRPGTWRPGGANDANLRAMVADPAHLRAGVAATTERGMPAAQAIRRMETDRRRPLPDTRAAQIGVVHSGTISPTPGGTGGGENAP